VRSFLELPPEDDDSMLASPFEVVDVWVRMLLSAINSVTDTDLIPLVAVLVTVSDHDVDCEPISVDDAPNDSTSPD